MKEKTCRERIGERMKSRLSDFLADPMEWTDKECREYLENERGANLDGDETLDDLRDRCAEKKRDADLESVLSVDKETVYDVRLSTGGPADGFRFVYRDGDLIRAEYYFKDWFDSASEPLDLADAETLANLFCAGSEFDWARFE